MYLADRLRRSRNGGQELDARSAIEKQHQNVHGWNVAPNVRGCNRLGLIDHGLVAGGGMDSGSTPEQSTDRTPRKRGTITPGEMLDQSEHTDGHTKQRRPRSLTGPWFSYEPRASTICCWNVNPVDLIVSNVYVHS